MAVENVDVIQAHPRQRLVQAGEQVLARSPLAVGPWPHVPARFGGDDQLVPVARQVRAQDLAEGDLRRAIRRAVDPIPQQLSRGRAPVVIGQVEVRHTKIKRPQDDRSLHVHRLAAAEVLPQPERDLRQLKTTAPAAAVRHLVVVSVRRRQVCHGQQSPMLPVGPGELSRGYRVSELDAAVAAMTRS